MNKNERRMKANERRQQRNAKRARDMTRLAENNPDTTVAERLYVAFGTRARWRKPDAKPMLQWSRLTVAERRCWDAVAQESMAITTEVTKSVIKNLIAEGKKAEGS